MPRNEVRAGPLHKVPARHDQPPARDTDPHSPLTVAPSVAAAVELVRHREAGKPA